MNTKSKIALSISIVMMLIALATVAIVAVWAATRQEFNSNINVSYTAMQVKGEASARWKVGGGEWQNMTSTGEPDGATSLVFGAATNENAALSPTDKNIKLTDENPYVVFEYKFVNTGSKDFAIDLFYEDDANADTNMSITCLNSDSAVTTAFEDNINTNFGNWTTTAISANGGTKYVYVLASILDIFNNASYSGSFRFSLDGKDYSDDLEFSAGTIIGLNNDVPVLRIPSKIDNTPVTTIAANAFADKTSLTEVIIPDSVETIEQGAFDINLSNLKYLRLPFVGGTKTTNTFLAYIFGKSSPTASMYGNFPTGLTNVIITGGSSLGTQAFYACMSLESVTIPTSVTTIGNGVFYNCSSLKSIYIPSSIKSMGGNVFDGCYSSYNKDGLRTVIIAKDSQLTTIGSGTFSGCRILESINLPDSITVIGTSAFENCNKLKSINLPINLTEIGYYAFSHCGLTSVTIPNTVTEIGDNAFEYCSLTNITIPGSVTNIGYHAFYYCSHLTEATIESQTVCRNLRTWEASSRTDTYLTDYVKTIKAKYEITGGLTGFTSNGQSGGYWIYTKS